MSNRALEVHLQAAEEFYLEDRLDRAIEAYGLAMSDYGWAGGGWPGFYNEVVWEKAARDEGRIWEIAADMSLEIPRYAQNDLVERARTTALEAGKRVQDFLQYQPSKPVLITILPPETPLEFIPGPYGYLAAKTHIHKICLPFTVLPFGHDLLQTLVHEYTHAAEHDLGNDRCPRWLAEGISMYLSGELEIPEFQEELREAIREFGMAPLWRVNSLISAWSNREIESGAGYAFAGSAVLFIVERYGRDCPGKLLRAVAEDSLSAVFKSALGIAQRTFEFDWRENLARHLGLPSNRFYMRLKTLLGL